MFVGLDFGVFAIYDLAFRAPQRLRAIIGLENPATPHNPQLAPLREAANWARDHFVHIHYFEPPGPADAALNAQPREFLTRVFYALSGDYHYSTCGSIRRARPISTPCRRRLHCPGAWLSELEMEFFVSEYARSWIYRRAQLVPGHGPALGAAAALRGREECGTVLFHRQRARLRPRGLARR